MAVIGHHVEFTVRNRPCAMPPNRVTRDAGLTDRLTLEDDSTGMSAF
jgi:hypothetical protein